MATITEQKIVLGLLEDEKNIKRELSNSISRMNAQTELMAQIAAYLWTEVGSPGSVVDSEHTNQISTEFNSVVSSLYDTVIPKLNLIGQLNAVDVDGNPDIATRETALNNLITTYSLDPVSFPNRYK